MAMTFYFAYCLCLGDGVLSQRMNGIERLERLRLREYGGVEYAI